MYYSLELLGCEWIRNFSKSPLYLSCSMYNNPKLRLVVSMDGWFVPVESYLKSSAHDQTRPGFFWNNLPLKMASSPSSRSPFACTPFVMLPTAPTKALSLTAFLMYFEKPAWYPGPSLKFCSGWEPPEDTSIKSTPKLAAFTDSCALSSRVQPSIPVSSNQSVALIRKNKGIVSGIVRLVSWITSRSRRMRFSKLPPYSSVLLLLTGLRNWWRRNPWAAWISMTSNPARKARSTELTQEFLKSAISDSVISLGIKEFSSQGTGLGPIISSGQPPVSLVAFSFPNHAATVEAFRPACTSWIPMCWLFWTLKYQYLSKNRSSFVEKKTHWGTGIIEPKHTSAVGFNELYVPENV